MEELLELRTCIEQHCYDDALALVVEADALHDEAFSFFVEQEAMVS